MGGWILEESRSVILPAPRSTPTLARGGVLSLRVTPAELRDWTPCPPRSRRTRDALPGAAAPLLCALRSMGLGGSATPIPAAEVDDPPPRRPQCPGPCTLLCPLCPHSLSASRALALYPDPTCPCPPVCILPVASLSSSPNPPAAPAAPLIHLALLSLSPPHPTQEGSSGFPRVLRRRPGARPVPPRTPECCLGASADLGQLSPTPGRHQHGARPAPPSGLSPAAHTHRGLAGHIRRRAASTRTCCTNRLGRGANCCNPWDLYRLPFPGGSASGDSGGTSLR